MKQRGKRDGCIKSQARDQIKVAIWGEVNGFRKCFENRIYSTWIWKVRERKVKEDA